MLSPSIRHIRAEHRRKAIAWSDRFVSFVTTRATVPERAGVGSCRDEPVIRRHFCAKAEDSRLNDERSGRLRSTAASNGRRRPGFSQFQLAPTVSRLT